MGELKALKRIAFVKQANIGNQVQVNTGHYPMILVIIRELSGHAAAAGTRERHPARRIHA